MQVDRRRRQIPPRRPRAVSFSVGDISLWFSQSLKYLTNRWREAVDTGRKPRQKAGFSEKKTALPRRLTNSRRPTNQRPVKSRRRVRKPFARLKYRNILYLILGAIAIGWIITLPFRSRRAIEPPVISPQEVLAPPTIPTPENVVDSSSDPTFTYNIKTPPNPVYSQELQVIVDEAAKIAATKGLPIEPLSISLLDVSNSQAHTSAGYQNQTLRFPASVAKLFWMVGFYSALEKGIITQKESSFTSDLEQMIRISNNDAASRILDKITDTQSGGRLVGEELQAWVTKRNQINTFFQSAGYNNIKITTKNYPIYYLRQEQPIGRDLQLRGDPSQPIRNQVTTDQAARLMYEIYTRQAVSSIASRKMAYLLTRDLDPKAWKNDPSNSIQGFLGESLPTNIYFGSKVGYTSKSRSEVAFVRTLDDRAIYILVVFADDPAYAKDETVFPAISRYVFDRLNARGPSR
ncbi:MAG: serine hydrolase [Tychonema bourrellyi B0820]|uniref:serine hydrolase n=1 Tax=Tychonema bourrellyi TaxID=54313 RepID=UPI001FE6256E|nr:serine hydrolase [Tychonema bourrellyi]MDQ2098519.1 serine hydrolase [Tychonema bourrellyi B0820]